MKTNKKTATPDVIAEAGFAVLSRNPGANLAEIAAAAGVTRATLHRYFPSRQNLIGELARRALQEMEDAVALACADARSAGDGLRRSMAALIPLGDRHGFLAHEQFEHDESIEQSFASIQSETARWIDAAKGEGEFDPHIPTEWISRAYDYLLYAAWDSIRLEETTPSQAAVLAWRTLTSGLGESDERR
ncbi:MAG: TetR/AcrR family transcriptional regulator [Pseudomonadota bacterium]